jgi:hypothetical protein
MVLNYTAEHSSSTLLTQNKKELDLHHEITIAEEIAGKKAINQPCVFSVLHFLKRYQFLMSLFFK